MKSIKRGFAFDDAVAMLEADRRLYRLSITKDRKLYVSRIKSVFRNKTDGKSVKYVSKKALAKAKELGIDLYSTTWLNQSKVDPKRKIFHYEHCNTISELCSAVLDTDEDIRDILKRDIVCWILKEEDKELNKHGYKSKRPGGWKKCYKECGIMYMKNTKELYK